MDKIRKYFKQTRNAMIELKSTPEIMFMETVIKIPN